MRAETNGPVCMSTIDTPLPVAAPSPPGFRGTRKPSHLTVYVLRIAEAASLVAFLSFCIMWVQWQTAGPGISKVSGDFVSFWTAGQLALEGHAGDAYLEVPHFFKQLALHGDPDWGYLAFFYPPFFLVLSAGFALLGYFPALVLWLTGTFALYVVSIRALIGKGLGEAERIWLLLVGYPAVMVNAGFGQNGFLSAALLGGAAVWMEQRPELAGICLGCLAYKPQLGIVVPLALAVAGRWRCFAAASVTVLTLAMVATVAFGFGIWPDFIAAMGEARHNWMEADNPLYLQYWISVFGAVRLHGGSLTLAYAAQAAVTTAAVFMLVRALWRAPQQAGLRKAEVAAIATCVPFCSPFILEYDLVILAVPIAWLLSEALRDGFRRGECLTLLGVFAAPVLFKITLFDSALKLTVIAAAAALFAAVLRRMLKPDASRATCRA
ncbi:MAG: glycosyltransferase family 87 protein [Xanthobacteraceae bacterium]